MTKSLSRHPSQSPEDWDHPESMVVDPSASAATTTSTTSRIAFPSQGGAAAADPGAPTPDAQSHRGGRAGKRTLSELLKLHAEKGTDVHFTSEEANSLEELLGQWINSSSSPYEGEDEFFTRPPQDDSIVLVRRSSTFHSIAGHPPRGQSESIALGS